MATTLKKSISQDSPQCEEQCVAHKISILQIFSKTVSIYTMLLQTIVRTAPTLLTLDVTVPNTMNTHKFHPASYLAQNSKFHHSISWLTLALQIFVNLYLFIFLHALCSHSSTNCKFYKSTN